MEDPDVVPRIDLGTLSILVLCYALSVIGNVQDYSLSENANFIPAALGWSPSQWSDIVGGNTYFIRAVVCLAVAGEVIDNLHNMRLLSAMLALAGLSTVLLTASHSFAFAFTARTAFALPSSVFYPLANNIAFARTHESLQGVASGVILLGCCSSDGLAIMLERIFTKHWRGSFYVDMTLMWLLATVCLFVPDPSSHRNAQPSKPWSVVVREVLTTYRSFGRMLMSSPALVCIIGFEGLQGALYATTTLTQVWLVRDMGLEASYVASRMIPMPFVMGIGSLVLGALGDTLSRRFGLNMLALAMIVTLTSIGLNVILTHLTLGKPGGDASFWLFLALQQSLIYAPTALAAPPASTQLLPEGFWGTSLAACFAAFNVGFGLAVKLGFHQADVSTAQRAELNGHPSGYGNGIVLISLLGLLHVPFVLVYLYCVKRDRPILTRISEEGGGMLPGPGEHAHAGKLDAHPPSGTSATAAQPLLMSLGKAAPGAGYGT